MGAEREGRCREIPQALALETAILRDRLEQSAAHVKEPMEINAARDQREAFGCIMCFEVRRERKSRTLTQITGQFQEQSLQDSWDRHMRADLERLCVWCGISVWVRNVRRGERLGKVWMRQESGGQRNKRRGNIGMTVSITFHRVRGKATPVSPCF